MSNLTPEERNRYSDMATKHADFLCEKVFKHAFEMAFIHGAKHMKEDMMSSVHITDQVAAFNKKTDTMSPAEVAAFNKQVANLHGDPVR